VDQVLGTDVLIEITEFFDALLISINDFIQYDTLRRAKAIGRAVVVGTVSELIRGGVVVANIVDANIKVGDTLYVYGKGLTGCAQVSGIQLDDVEHESVGIKEGREVGLKLGIRPKTGCELLRLV
jgi:hypothetical protein